MALLARGASFPSVSATTVVVSIAHANHTSDILLASLRIDDILNEAPNLAYFTTKVGSSLTPTVGQDVKIGLGGIDPSHRIFGGSILSVTQIYQGIRANVAYQVTCSDDTSVLTRRYPVGIYGTALIPVSATSVVTDLILRYASASISTGNVAAGLPTVTVSFDGSQDLASCLTTVANLAGGYWYPDANHDLHFFITEATGTPSTIDATNISPSNVNGARSLTATTDLSQVRSKVFVHGAESSAVIAVAPGATVIPVQSNAVFSSGQVLVSGGQVVGYTGCTGDQQPVAAPAGTFVLSTASGTGTLNDGKTFAYQITYTTAYGETLPTTVPGTQTTGATGNQNQIDIRVTPTSGTYPFNATGVNLYRTLEAAAGTGPYFFVPNIGTGAIFLASLAASGFFTATDTTRADGTIAPPTVSTAGPYGTAGSTTNGSTAVGSTTVGINQSAAFNKLTGGVVLVTVAGTPHLITYTGVTQAYGTGALSGVPASGYGSVTVTIPTLTVITGVPALTGVPVSGGGALQYPVAQGDTVALWVQRDDLTAQATLALLEGGDGVHEHTLTDSTLTSVAACQARGDAELALFKNALQALTYSTRDMLTRSGKTVTVSLGSPTNISVSLQIQQATWTGFDAVGNYPLIAVKAAQTKFTLQDAIRRAALKT